MSSTPRDKFKQATRILECDDDPELFRDRVAKTSHPTLGVFGKGKPEKQ